MKRNRLQRTIAKELERIDKEKAEGTLRDRAALLANGVPLTIPADAHMTDGILDNNGKTVLGYLGLVDYLCSSCITDGRGLFSITKAEATDELSQGWEQSNDQSPYFESREQILEYISDMELSDVLLLVISQCEITSVPMLFYVLSGRALYSNVDLLYSPLKRLSELDYVNKVSPKNVDLPFFGAVAKYYYSATQKGLKHLKDQYPLLRINAQTAGATGTMKQAHGYHTTLTAVHLFTLLRSRGVIPFLRYETALVTQERVYQHGYDKRTASDDVQCDALLSYPGGTVAVEQDMNTESLAQVLDKIDSYFSSGAVGYGKGKYLNTATSCVLFATHTANITGRESVLKATAPYNITHNYLNLDFYFRLGLYIDKCYPGFPCEGNSNWENQLKEYVKQACALYGKGVYRERGADRVTKYELRADNEHLPITVNCIKEILAFYHALDPKRYDRAAYALLALAGFSGKEQRYGKNYRDYVACLSDFRLYHYHYSAYIQQRPTLRRLTQLAGNYVKKVRDFSGGMLRIGSINGDIGKELGCIASGFPFYVIPGLAVGKYAPLIFSDQKLSKEGFTISTATLTAARAFDTLAYGKSVKRTYYPVTPGYSGSPETMKGVAIDNLVGDYELRLRNCAVSSGEKLTVCLELFFDACSWARTAIYTRIVRQRIKRVERSQSKGAEVPAEDIEGLKKNDRKIVIVCESVHQIRGFAKVCNLYNRFEGTESLNRPEEVCYVMLSQLRTATETGAKLPVYLCTDDGSVHPAVRTV